MRRNVRPSLKKTSTAAPLSGRFFRAVMQRLDVVDKLGDLLMLGGLITRRQLDKALAEQERTREPLGKILIRHKSVPAVHLYRKLAEQWFLRATAAGLTLILTAPATVAQADLPSYTGLSTQFTLAAATPAPSKTFYQPGLFGTREIKSNDISAFTKWTRVMDRFEAQAKSVSSRAPRVLMWKNELQRLKGRSQHDQILAINDFMNSVPFIEDRDNYGRTDYWATPVEFLTHGGDCEDFAIAKYASLRALGFKPEQLRVAIVQDQVKNIPHAILIVYASGNTYVLDNQNKNLETAEVVSRYKPIFSINSQSWWLYRA